MNPTLSPDFRFCNLVLTDGCCQKRSVHRPRESILQKDLFHHHLSFSGPISLCPGLQFVISALLKVLCCPPSASHPTPPPSAIWNRAKTLPQLFCEVDRNIEEASADGTVSVQCLLILEMLDRCLNLQKYYKCKA